MSKSLSCFIFDANKIHNDKYDYSKSIYVNSKVKLCIICKKHGEFFQTPNSHLNGSGCPRCGGENISIKLNLGKNKFIELSSKKHNNKYNYDLVEYVNNSLKVCITCPEHGNFWQTPASHLNGRGCPCCSGLKPPTSDDWIKNAKKVHGDRYDYSKIKYVSSKVKVCIICPEHGEFLMSPINHIFSKQGCPKCGKINYIEKVSLGLNKFVEKAIIKHGLKYDYKNVIYVNNRIKVEIKCPEHGVFFISPDNHLSGRGCPVCSKEMKKIKSTSTSEEFIKKANVIHNNKYKYNNVVYVHSRKKVFVTCSEHGDFKITPNEHLNGVGCQLCNKKYKLQEALKNLLINENINFEIEKTYSWLKYIGFLRLDFYLPEYNIAIECQGKQHFEPVDFSGHGHEIAGKEFLYNFEKDKEKFKLCEQNDVKLIYFFNKKFKNKIVFYDDKLVFYEIGDLIKYLKSCKN